MNRIMQYILIGSFLLMGTLQIQCSKGDAKNKNKESENITQNDSTSNNKENSSKKKNGKNEGKKVDDIVPVEVTSIKRGNISDYLLQSSNLETEKMADVYSRVQGLVDAIYFEEGQYVKKGNVLLELEADEYELAEQRAKVNYQQKKNAYERVEAIHLKKLISKEEYEQAKFAAASAKIEWQQAQLNLDYTRITAPISGYVVERLCRPGDRIQTTNKLFTIINTDEMIAVIHVPEKEIETIQKGQPAFIMSAHLGNEQFSGWIKRVSPAVDPQSGTFKVTIGVHNKDNKLRPGMFVNAHVITSTHDNAILIPKTAIVYENERMNVFVVRDSIAYKIALAVGFQNHEKVESLTDIEEGEKVIVVGQSGLKDNTKVKIVMEKEG